jgi:hypothetical protein
LIQKWKRLGWMQMGSHIQGTGLGGIINASQPIRPSRKEKMKKRYMRYM